MKKLRLLLHVIAVMVMLTMMCGCEGGTSTASGSSGAVSVVTVNSGNYIVQGNGLNGAAGLEITLSYSNMTGPTVVQGTLINEAMMLSNCDTPGIIKIAIITTKPITGNGQIASISFDAGLIDLSNITLDSVKIIDINGNPIQ
jgi:hypothetical protein